MVTADLATQRLTHLLPAWAAAEQGIFAIYPGNRFIPTKVRAFVDFLDERLRGLAPVPAGAERMSTPARQRRRGSNPKR